jgi:acyl carrier protein
MLPGRSVRLDVRETSSKYNAGPAMTSGFGNAKETRALIRAFLARYFKNTQVGDDVDLFANGYVTSAAALNVVVFIEKQFGVTLDPEDLAPDNFRSVDALTRLVARKQRKR